MATVKRRILDDQTFKEQTNTTNRMLASIAKAVAGGGGSLDVDDVVEFATLLGAGVGQICSIGKQFHVPKETSITVGTDKVEGSTLAVTINEDAFLAAMGHAEERAFEAEYDGAVWHWVDKAAGTVILADYGITATGTPKEGDKIVIVESASRIAWDLMQYNPAGYTLLHDTTGRGDSALLYAHKIQSYGTIPFCPAKLLYYTQNGMPAGTYKFTLYKAAYASGAAYDGDYVFTLTQPIPAYGGFRIPGIGGWKLSYGGGLGGGGAASCECCCRGQHERQNERQQFFDAVVLHGHSPYKIDLPHPGVRRTFWGTLPGYSGSGVGRIRPSQLAPMTCPRGAAPG